MVIFNLGLKQSKNSKKSFLTFHVAQLTVPCSEVLSEKRDRSIYPLLRDKLKVLCFKYGYTRKCLHLFTFLISRNFVRFWAHQENSNLFDLWSLNFAFCLPSIFRQIRSKFQRHWPNKLIFSRSNWALFVSIFVKSEPISRNNLIHAFTVKRSPFRRHFS